MTYSPGPWMPGHFVDNCACNCATILDEGHFGGICTIHIGNGKLVGEGGNDAPPLEEAKGNAHLIAASPDMFELLTRLEYWLDTDTTFPTEADARKNAEWLAEIRGVIKKAKGEKI